jgi:malonyl-CoA/methylmalonyl-CoA synthetase
MTPAAAPAGPGTTLPALWSSLWAAEPDRPILFSGEHPTVAPWTGSVLDRRSSAVAGVLAASGVSAGDRVLWSCSATLPAIAGLLGVLRLGAVVVSVSPSSTRSELDYVVDDAAPRAALVEREEQEGWLAGRDLAVVRVDGDLVTGPGAGGVALDVARPDHDALIVYTSGTTGAPKGAVHTHQSLAAGVHSLVEAWDWQPSDRLILALPLFHVHGLCAGLFGTLTAGASATVCTRFTEATVLGAVDTLGCTMFFGVPTMYHRLVEGGRAGGLAALRLCVSGSAPLAADLWRRLDGLGVPVLERYGMTETLLTLSNPLEGERRPGSVGHPLPGVEMAISEPDEHGVGELLVRGPSLCRGYWGRPDPICSPDGWFATGDLVSLEDGGYVVIRGRRSDMIITGGHNVYPAEVEAVLSRHPSVAEVAVVGVPSDEWGESVVAYVVGASGGGDPDVGALEALADEALAPFKRPRSYTVLDALPRNAMGKVVRRSL